MNKCLVMLLMTLGLAACKGKDEHYYLTHPLELQAATKACPSQQPQGLSCQQVDQIANRMNALAYQMQYSPQGFGKRILALQQTIADQKMELGRNKDNSELKNTLQKNQHDLIDLLAVVKWLQSPEG